jgi:hypothetical protein
MPIHTSQRRRPYTHCSGFSERLAVSAATIAISDGGRSGRRLCALRHWRGRRGAIAGAAIAILRLLPDDRLVIRLFDSAIAVAATAIGDDDRRRVDLLLPVAGDRRLSERGKGDSG